MTAPTFGNFANMKDAYKDQLEKYITDKSVPLDDRWKAWMEAPRDLKNHSGWNEDFDGIPDDYVMYDGPVHAERHQTVDIDHILEAAEGAYGDEHKLSDEDLIKFKEDVLRKNMGSFEYDW